jgi:hypothetical protein
MRSVFLVKLAGGWVLCLAGLSAMATGSLAQEVVAPVVPIGAPGSYPIGHGWGCFHQPVFPRTYSYQYDRWFNRPRHTRFVGPDGGACWRQTTVRGLPLGVPWPPY